MVMTPMDAFDINVSENQVLRILERTSSITWLMDMILSFARTYGKLNGTEERHLAATSRNYLRTWLVFDFTLVCLDMFIFVIEDTTWVRYMSFFRIIRLFRLLRVLRLAKVKARIAVLAQLLHIMQTQHITDRGLLMLNIVKSLLAVTVINHFTACTWYAVGTILNDENNWVTAHFREPGAVPKPDSLLYLYTTAYHWSITQLTPASMEIYPQSARERIFNIAVILFGLCVFSSFISSMAQQLSALQQLSKSDRHKMQVLRRFISENKMSVALATTIVDFVRQRKSPQAQRPLKVSDIEIFATFPSVLLQKIRTEAHYFVLGKHSLFQCVYNNDRDTFSRVCNTCIVEQSVDRGHDVFKVGDKGAAMYVVNHGKLAYALGMDDLFDPTDSQEWLNLKENNLASIISSGTVVSEVAVWLDWVHRGRLYGEAVLTDLLCVDTDLFQEVMRKSVLLKDIRLYARLFALRAIRIGHQGYLDDLWYE
ncbi:CNGA3, partial [Symbiodinium microadriaticum]